MPVLALVLVPVLVVVLRPRYFFHIINVLSLTNQQEKKKKKKWVHNAAVVGFWGVRIVARR